MTTNTSEPKRGPAGPIAPKRKAKSSARSAISASAKAVGIGRYYLYPLAAAGEAGVERALGLLRTEIERGMKLMGCTSSRQLSRVTCTLRRLSSSLTLTARKQPITAQIENDDAMDPRPTVMAR